MSTFMDKIEMGPPDKILGLNEVCEWSLVFEWVYLYTIDVYVTIE